ncbi:MAG: DNA-3-methyladenine glycosylase 2 family protein [Gammaproteobacteria bacterium]
MTIRSGAQEALIVHAVPPFRLDLTVWALRRRSRNAIDRWDGVTYRRVIVVEGRAMELAVHQAGSSAKPHLIATTAPSIRTVSEECHVRSIVEDLLGPRIDLDGWYRMSGRDPRLRALAGQFKGVKPPRFPTVFEALVNGFACQQLSLVVGLELLNRLATLCATRRGRRGRVAYAFPTPHDVVQLPPAQYQAIGFSRQKVRALLALARDIEQGNVSVEGLAHEDDPTARARLLALRGVGRWTAEYVMLRGLGRLNVFPGDDVGAQKNLARWLGRPAPLDYAGVNAVVEKWQPYAGMVYFHLLLDGLSKAGALGSAA